MIPQYETETVATPADADEVGHVNNVVYLAWAERIAREHAESLGFGVEGCREMGGWFVARRHVISYERPAFPGETVRLSTALHDVGRATATRTVEMRRGLDLLATCVTEWAWIDPDGRPRRFPPQLLDRLPEGAR